MRTAMSASRRSRLVSSFEATSSISISGCWPARRASTAGSSQVAATWLVVMRTTPPVAERAVARPRPTASAASSMRRAASTMASAAPVGTTPRPVRSNSGAPSCASSSATCRLSVGWRAPLRWAAALTLPASRTARKLRTKAQSKSARAAELMRKCMARMQQRVCIRTRPASTLAASTTALEPEIAMNPAPASTRTVLILGANGRFGLAAAQAFAAAGWHVLAQVRRGAAVGMPAAAELVQAPLGALADVRRGQRAPDVVVHGINPVYTRWDEEALPAARAAMDLAERLGARFMLPGNVYNYGAAMPALLDESTPQRPTTAKGRIRVAMERELERRAVAGRLRATVITAGDFFGAGSGSWFDAVVVKSIAKGRLGYPGHPRGVHAWAYLPDLARAGADVVPLARPARARRHEAGAALSGPHADPADDRRRRQPDPPRRRFGTGTRAGPRHGLNRSAPWGHGASRMLAALRPSGAFQLASARGAAQRWPKRHGDDPCGRRTRLRPKPTADRHRAPRRGLSRGGAVRRGAALHQALPADGERRLPAVDRARVPRPGPPRPPARRARREGPRALAGGRERHAEPADARRGRDARPMGDAGAAAPRRDHVAQRVRRLRELVGAGAPVHARARCAACARLRPPRSQARQRLHPMGAGGSRASAGGPAARAARPGAGPDRRRLLARSRSRPAGPAAPPQGTRLRVPVAAP